MRTRTEEFGYDGGCLGLLVAQDNLSDADPARVTGKWSLQGAGANLMLHKSVELWMQPRRLDEAFRLNKTDSTELV